jgi:isopenicillin N synthase-like dioxygenase
VFHLLSSQKKRPAGIQKYDVTMVPIVDISPFVDDAAYDDESRRRVAVEWDMAMTNVGFAIIAGHGVHPRTITELRNGALDFFAMDASTKVAYDHGPYGIPLGGYTGVGIEAVSRTRDVHGSDGGGGGDRATVVAAAPPDLVESFVFKPESSMPKPPALEIPGAAYHAALLRVLDALHRLTAASLGLPSDYFVPYYTPHDPDTISLRLSYYPPISPEAQLSSSMRYGDHTDYTGYTILHQDEADVGDIDAGGLQVLMRSGEWMAVPPTPGTFVVNIGDLYEVWTNGRWKSTVHRVTKPPPGSIAATSPRLSIPFFTGPRNDAIIEALPTCVDVDRPQMYPPVRALDHLLRKLRVSNT